MQDLTVTESNIKLNVSIREWIKWTQTYTHFHYLLLFTLRQVVVCTCLVYSYRVQMIYALVIHVYITFISFIKIDNSSNISYIRTSLCPHKVAAYKVALVRPYVRPEDCFRSNSWKVCVQSSPNFTHMLVTIISWSSAIAIALVI